MTGLTCLNCSEESPAQFRFCGYCGSSLVETSTREARKTVTAIFCDLKGSTSLAESLDSESLREVITHYFAVMRPIIEEHGGTVENLVGDALLAVFGLRETHEDDPLRAVRAAAAMKTALVDLNRDLARRWGVTLTNRSGISTGEVVARDPGAGQRLVIGDAVNTAARLEQSCPPNDILIGGETYAHVRELVEVEALEPLSLKGKAERVPAYRLLSIGERPVGTRSDLPMVGRGQELTITGQIFAEAVAASECRIVTVLGEAGVGKSRLTEEIAASLPDVRMLRGRCLPYGRGITFWPLAEIVRVAAGMTELDEAPVALAKLAALTGDQAVTDRVAAAMGLSERSFSVEETFWGARRLLETLAAGQPLLVIFEDIHWAEATFLDFVEHLAESADGPLLVLCPARPELVENRADWGTVAGMSTLTLEPLTDAACVRVVDSLLGGGTIAPHALEKIVRAAEGNPLYVEQLLSMLVDDGTLRHVDGRWEPTKPLNHLSVPSTIQALVAARLDCLRREERTVIEPASVIGGVFTEEAVAHLVDPAMQTQVPVRLASLAAKKLIRPLRGHALVDEGYGFGHGVIRETVYNGLLKRDRARLHEQFVAWAEEVDRSRGRETEFEEILGWHLEQAHRCLAELGTIDRHARELGERGAEKLAAAGRRAFGRGDMPAAANLLQRASELLPAGDARRLALLPDLGEALIELGSFDQAQALLDEAVQRAEEADLVVVEQTARLARMLLDGHTSEAEAVAARVVDEAAESLAAFTAAEDHAGLAMAHRVIAWASGTLCRYAAAADAAHQAMVHARLAGDQRQARRAASQYAVAALYGPTAVDEAIDRCEEIVAESSGDHRTAGLTMSVLSRLVAMAGDVERGRELYRDAREMLEEIGHSVVSCSTSLDSCGVEMLARDPAAAERELRRDHAALSEMGERYLLSTVTAELARAVEAQGRWDEAHELTIAAEKLTAEDDLASAALWRTVRAKVLARRGRRAEAVALARDAADGLRVTDAVVTQADALIDLAEVLALGEDSRGAAEALEEALELARSKGNVLGAELAQQRLETLLVVAGASSEPLAPLGRYET